MRTQRDAFVAGFRDGMGRGTVEEYGPRARWHESLRVPLILIGWALFMFSCNASDFVRKRTAAWEACAKATELTDPCSMILMDRSKYVQAIEEVMAEVRKGGPR